MLLLTLFSFGTKDACGAFSVFLKIVQQAFCRIIFCRQEIISFDYNHGLLVRKLLSERLKSWKKDEIASSYEHRKSLK